MRGLDSEEAEDEEVEEARPPPLLVLVQLSLLPQLLLLALLLLGPRLQDPLGGDNPPRRRELGLAVVSARVAVGRDVPSSVGPKRQDVEDHCGPGKVRSAAAGAERGAHCESGWAWVGVRWGWGWGQLPLWQLKIAGAVPRMLVILEPPRAGDPVAGFVHGLSQSI